ncbi:DUF192 domain-containing protein [bacterium]|nr:DUF192 domain-containing protein [bacterium]
MARKSRNNAGYGLVILAAVVFIFVLNGLPARKAAIDFSGDGSGGGISITAEVADTPFLREKGLMFIRSLPQNSGMLFIFESPRELRFWMKNTLIPLDMIFVSENFTIVNIAENAQPCAADCPLYYSAAPAKYVVETNAGFAKENGIRVGNNVVIE